MKNYIMYGAVGVVVIAAGAYFMMGSSSQSSLSSDEMNERNAQVSESSVGTMADIMARGGAWKCTVSTTASGVTSGGTVYVADGKVRGDFTSQVPQAGTVEVHMIADGTYAYTWTNMMKTGFKMSTAKPAETNDTPTAYAQDFYNAKYDYQCSPWTADASKFVLPTDITFNDMSSMMPAAGAGAGASASGGPSCSTCDMIPDAGAKAQCRTALKCK